MKRIMSNQWKTILLTSLGLIIATVIFATVTAQPFDVPDAPGKPEVVDGDKDFCSIVFDVPKSDGGAPITHYIIEQRESYSPYWVKILQVIHKGPSKKTVFVRITNLFEGNTYYFRARAVNLAGSSEPSEASDYYIAKKYY